MSSTTDRTRERGQVLVLFAGGLVALLVVAALAFDVGMMLVERRDQQNAADAAALAGARYVLLNEADAEAAARDLARDNGFDDADANVSVDVHIPAIHGRYAGFPGFIEVQIEATRPSIFGGVIGRAAWPVGAMAVATNGQNMVFPFSMLALNPTECKAIAVSGGGQVEAHANIQSNSSGADCDGDPIGFSRTGGSTINVIAPDATCRAVGEVKDEGAAGSMTCTKAENSFALPDPLRNLAAPTQPGLAPAVLPIGHTKAPGDYCPGVLAPKDPNASTPRMCDLAGNASATRDLAWVLYPGLYPGGLTVDNGARAYMLPGIYWIGGGGLDIGGSASIMTIAQTSDAVAYPGIGTWGGGVMIYNTTLPGAGGAAGPFVLNSNGAAMKLKPLDAPTGSADEIYDDIVIFQDRTLSTSVTLNGAASTTTVEGIVYVPGGQVKLNGNGGTLVVDQIIADTYDINGDGGTIQVMRNKGVDAIISAAGLVD